MAELIPTQYRLRVVQREHIAKWVVTGALTVILAVLLLGYAFFWQRQQSKGHESLQARYHDKSTLIFKSEDLRTSRQELAGRMQQVQQLMDDKTLLTLLRNISESFGNSDTLEYISIDAALQSQGKTASEHNSYAVNIRGITANLTTLGELTKRLGSGSTNVVVESSTRDNSLDSHPMRFQIRCEKAVQRGT